MTATNYNDTGLAGGTIYYYVVSAANSGGEGTNSPQAAAATLSPTVGSLAHRYSFSETNGTTVADSVGGPVWNGRCPTAAPSPAANWCCHPTSSSMSTFPQALCPT